MPSDLTEPKSKGPNKADKYALCDADLIEIIAARGNSALESVVTLSTRLRRDIDVLSQKMANLCSGEATPVSRGNKQDERKIEDELREIIEKIEDIGRQ